MDIGAGSGTDTVELLRRGWHVLAIDGDPHGIERLRKRANDDERLETHVGRFEDERWSDVDLVNASFALFFCTPQAFVAVWRRVVDSLRPGGRFAGHLLGDRDTWAANPDMNHHTRGVAERLLTGLEVELFEESEEPQGRTAVGDSKHWHSYHVVARKPAR